MRLALVNHSRIILPSEGRTLNSNSIGLWSYWVATRLADRCDVTVYHQVPGSAVLEEECGGVAFRGIPVRTDERSQRMWRRWDRVRARIGWRGNPRRPRFAKSSYSGYADQVARDLAERECDVVQISNYPHFAQPIRARNPDAVINLHMQCDWLVQLDRDLLEPYLRCCDLISGCSDHVTEGIRRRFPAHADRCFTLYNGVNLDQFTPGTSPEAGQTPHVLFVGRLSPEKGVHTLLRALEIVARTHPDLRVSIVGARGQAPYEFIVALDDDPLVRELAQFYGDGPYTYEKALHGMVPAALGERIQFINHIPQAELQKLYQTATLFAFPSEWHEPFGMPVIEAMACGVPVVVTDSGGIPEFAADGKAGLVVPRGDVEALASAIGKLVADPDLRQRMGTAGRATVMNGFTWRHVADSLYERLLAAASRDHSDAIGEGGRT